MAKILSYKNNSDKFLPIVVLIISIVITNSFIIFSPDEDSRFYFSGLTSTLALGVALVISIAIVYRYKKSIKKQEEKQQAFHNRATIRNLIIMIITRSISPFVYFLHSG
jgi:amino acid transporter